MFTNDIFTCRSYWSVLAGGAGQVGGLSAQQGTVVHSGVQFATSAFVLRMEPNAAVTQSHPKQGSIQSLDLLLR